MHCLPLKLLSRVNDRTPSLLPVRVALKPSLPASLTLRSCVKARTPSLLPVRVALKPSRPTRSRPVTPSRVSVA